MRHGERRHELVLVEVEDDSGDGCAASAEGAGAAGAEGAAAVAEAEGAAGAEGAGAAGAEGSAGAKGAQPIRRRLSQKTTVQMAIEAQQEPEGAEYGDRVVSDAATLEYDDGGVFSDGAEPPTSQLQPAAASA